MEGNFFIKNNTVICWDQQFIYVSKVFDNKLEIVNFIKLKEYQNIRYISLEDTCIFLNNNNFEENNEERQGRRFAFNNNDSGDDEYNDDNDNDNDEYYFRFNLLDLILYKFISSY